MNLKTRVLAGASSLAIAGSMVAGFAAAPAGAAVSTVLTCTGMTQTAKLNPHLTSNTPRYVKAGASGINGSCAVDAGISTENPATDSTKANPYDNQTNGHSTLTVLSNKVKVAGSTSCNTADPAIVAANVYPNSYPLNGKQTIKFNELNEKFKNIQLQAFLYLTGDVNNPTAVTAEGVVTKGPGVGGNVTEPFTFGPAVGDTKSVHFVDCLDTVAGPGGIEDGYADLVALDISQAAPMTVTVGQP